MSSNAHYNGQIPTDQIIVLFLALACIAYAHTLTYEQAQALTATGGIAEFVLLFHRLLQGRR